MKKLLFTYLSLLCIGFSSCYSYKVYPKKYRTLENNGIKPTAYIINYNDSLKNEHDILVHSNLFNLTKDDANIDLKIKLYPIRTQRSCGQPFSASVFTLGQLPVLYTDRYFYRFDEIKGDSIMKRELELKIATQSWFWDMFVFKKKFEEHAGKALLGEYQNMPIE